MAEFFDASEILKVAVRIEENGLAFYRQMAGKFKGSETEKLFIFLAGEEEEHRRVFEGLLSKVGSYEPAEGYSGEHALYLSTYANEHIFNKEKSSSIAADKIKTAKEAIEFAVGRELESILYYLEIKNLIPENQKGTIDKIIEEERSHYLKLSGIQKNS